jgi:lysozyme family protein
MNFDKAFELLIGVEGGFTDDPKDRGNWTSGKIGVGTCKGTKYGLSAMSYPSLDIKNLSLDQAKEIYKKDWWSKLKLDLLPSEISYDLFDTAINSGISNAVKILQKTVGTKEDGVIGNNTISLVQAQNKDKLSARFNAHRLLFMTDISTWSIYGKGWARRVAHNILL